MYYLWFYLCQYLDLEGHGLKDYQIYWGFSKTIGLKLNKESGKDTNLMAMVVDSDGNEQRWLYHGWERKKKIGAGVQGFQYFSGRDLFSCLTENLQAIVRFVKGFVQYLLFSLKN